MVVQEIKSSGHKKLENVNAKITEMNEIIAKNQEEIYVLDSKVNELQKKRDEVIYTMIMKLEVRTSKRL